MQTISPFQVPKVCEQWFHLLDKSFKKKDLSYPSYETIGQAIGRKESSVAKYVQGLVEKHLLYTEPTTVWGKGGLKRNGNLRFAIRPIEEAKRYHVEQQMLENERKRLEEKAA